MKVLVTNLASPANPGDQAILAGALKLIRSYYNEPEITVATRAYGEREAYEAYGCHVVANYPNVEYLATDSTIGKLLNVPRALLDPHMLKNAVKEADVIFLIGGAYFYSYRNLVPGFTYLSHFSPIYFANKFKKPVVFLPQSYGPFNSHISHEMFDWAVMQAKQIFYREDITGSWLYERYPGLKNKIGFMPDLAFNLERQDLVSEFKKNMETKRVGVTVRAWQSEYADQFDYIKVLRDVLVWLHEEHGYAIRIIVQVQDPKKGEGDEWISEMLYDHIKTTLGVQAVELKTSPTYFSLQEICSLYQECDFLIGMRLHSALLSYLVGRPSIVAGYQHKAEGILKKLGLEQLYMGSFDEIDRGLLQESCRQVIKNREMWGHKIESAVHNARQDINRVFYEQMKGIT